MKIAIIVPREDHFATAGVRIRYQRIKPRLQAAGHIFELLPIDRLQARSEYAFDTYIFCKCHDARSLLLADTVAKTGAHVGVDLFDDYYSQTHDSRFVHFREWLRRIVPSLTFAVCSTERMRINLATLLPKVPFHIINDPFDELDQERVAATVERNVERALSTHQLDVGWFGIGDNAHFPVGLSDLFAFGGSLSQARRMGFEPRLSILTNSRAMTAERLEMLARLPIPYVLEEWTEELERHLIANSLLCFLPVNAQPFSVVKSLNRAVTTLVGGAQVLSAGYPLYAELGPFIYRDLETLLNDVEDRKTALRRDTVADLRDRLEILGDPDAEASKLISFLNHLPANNRQASLDEDVQAIVHGIGALNVVHKFAKGFGTLSVASPISIANLDYDVRIRFDPSTQKAFAVISQAAYQRLRPLLKRGVKPSQETGEENYYQIQLPANLGWGTEDLLLEDNTSSASIALSTYTAAIEKTLSTLQSLFGEVTVHVSEAKSPYWRQTPRLPLSTDTDLFSDTGTI
jgi:hypothetical protein